MKTGTYKGKTYRVKFIGKTKFGQRAHLEFMDGSKSFWVDASLVSVSQSAAATSSRRSSSPRVSYGCWECPCCEEENPESSGSCWECGCGKPR